jgi:uncharacterized membrane protein
MSEARAGRAGVTDTVRTEAFSDGVFAIAITLLVLEIRIPVAGATRHGRDLLAALGHLWPSFLGYVLSFLTIGIMWANHHSIFRHVRRADRCFVMLNIVLLMCISFLPFPTAILAQYLPEQEGRRAAVALYSATLEVIALAYNALWWYAVGRERLLDPGADRRAVRTISRRYALGPLAYGLSFGLAFVNVWASLAVNGLLAGFYLLPEHRRGER